MIIIKASVDKYGFSSVKKESVTMTDNKKLLFIVA